MQFRAWELVRAAGLLAVLSIIFFSHARAAGDMAWQFNENGDPANGGRMVSRLVYGVPETDNSQVRIECKAPATGKPAVTLTFGADVGDLKDGAATNLRFTGGGFNHFVSGKVHGTQAEVGLTGVRVDLDTGDPLWDAMSEKDALDYLVPGYSANKLALKEGHRQIGSFVEACKSYVKAKPVMVADAGIKLAAGPSSGGGVSEKEAFDAAKELGTVEAWEAFLENFPKGFRADLARAYVKRLGSDVNKATPLPTPPSDQATAPPPSPPSPPDISLAMTAQGICAGGQNCTYAFIATNAGGQTFTGPLVIATSVAPGGASLSSPGAPPWQCEGMGGGAVCSNYSANISPGQSMTIPLTFSLPRNAGGQVTSCASISWGGAPSASGARDVQQALNNLGFNVGAPDGKAGRKTVDGIRTFQERNGLQPTGEIDLPLLLALFTQGGAGDVNPANDQACAGSAVFSAPPAPAASYTPPRASQYCADGRLRQGGKCVCPSSVPVWTGKTCVPRLARNCSGGRYYSKNRKLCLCPSSTPHWYNNRCHARVDACPGDSVRVGDKCIKESDPALAARPGTSAPQVQAGCGPNTIRIGAVCVNIQQAPVFGGSGQRKQTITGGGGPNNRQGGGQTTQKAAPIGPPPNMKVIQQKQDNQVKKTGANSCPPGMQYDPYAYKNRCKACPAGTSPYFGVCCPPDKPNVSCSKCCPRGHNWTGSRCQAFAETRCSGTGPLACYNSYVLRGGECVPGPKTATPKLDCLPGFVQQGVKCVPRTITDTRKVACPPGSVLQGTKCVPATVTGTRRTGVPCVNGQVVNGQCQCPPNLPRYSKGQCKKANTKFILKQLTQPQNQPQPQNQQQQPQNQQQQPQNQQQQQQIQIPGLGGITISDARLKHDIAHLATLENGLRLYSFRYLWDDREYVGVMAQDLLEDPARRVAVSRHPSGYYQVDYGLLGLKMATRETWRARGPAAIRQARAGAN